MKRLIYLMLAAVLAVGRVSAVGAAEGRLAAFPGAEGGGKYTTGGRGGEVYVVTTLEDYMPGKEEPIKGSLRDALSGDNRIVVFNVGGVIHLKDSLHVIRRKNLTVLGQTAPGGGITLYGYETNISNTENMIMRYMRFRPGAENVLEGDSMDSLWGRSMKDIIMDHISCSWSTDETMSLYRAGNMTVQWSLVAESLTMSGHTKGRHGYGAIAGGVNTTYHHNLYASHTSRNPRFGGGTVEADDNEHIAHFDFRNNVIYNWGFNTGYGGGRAESNYVFNYMKPGPGTRDSVKARVFDCGEKDKPSWFYINGNVLEGNAEITDDNSKGIYISNEAKPFTTLVNKEFEMEGTKPENLHTDTPQEAYKLVLARAGAVYPVRDAVDARIIQSVKDNTGYFANTDADMGGLPYTETVKRPPSFDKDSDGIADEWELKNGLDPKDPTDSAAISASGYANIELYANSLADMAYEPTNPEVSLAAPANNMQYKTGESVRISVNADSSVKKVDFYVGDTLVGSDNSAPFAYSVSNLKDGSYYISAKATNDKGEQTCTMPHTVHINAVTDMGDWQQTDIGKPPVSGSASLTDGRLTVKGSGKLKGKNDTMHFVYQKLTGDFDFVTKVDSITPVDNHAFSGIMARNSLEPGSAAIGVGISHTKAYEWKETDPETGKSSTLYRNPFGAYFFGRDTDGGNMDELAENLDSLDNAAKSGVKLLKDVQMKTGLKYTGSYLRLTRSGDRFTAYSSANGVSWVKIGTKQIRLNDELYVGVGADGNKVDNDIDNLNTAVFSGIKIK